MLGLIWPLWSRSAVKAYNTGLSVSKSGSEVKETVLDFLRGSGYNNRYKRMWPSGRASASQAEDRGFESRHPLHFYLPA
jgi:hypothetical protein